MGPDVWTRGGARWEHRPDGGRGVGSDRSRGQIGGRGGARWESGAREG